MERFRLRPGRLQSPRNASITLALSALMFMLCLVGCGIKEEIRPGSEITFERTTFSFDKKDYTFDILPMYRVVPGDILDVLYQVRTWEEKDTFKLAVDHTVTVKFVHVPELNEEQRVRPDGNISLPYLGNVYVVGRTLDELIQELKKRYSSILQNPDLYVIVPEFRSRIKELKADLHTAPRGLSRLVTVRPDGYVTFPMLGDVFVAKKTLPDINKELNTMYDRILPGLHVDLFLEKHAGSKIYILGQVKSPGAYDISKPMTLAEILAISGSFLPGAKLDSVIVMRRHEGKVVATKIDFRNTLTAKGGYTLFFLKPDDIVYVPKKVITEAGELMRDLADVLLFRGWSVGFSWELHKEPDITIKQ